MKKRLIYSIISAISVIVGAIFFPSFGGASNDEPQTKGVMDDSTFVNTVRTSTVMYATSSDDDVIAAAHRICKSLDLGMTGTQARDTLILSDDASAIKDADYMTSASILQYCTKYSAVAAQFVHK